MATSFCFMVDFFFEAAFFELVFFAGAFLLVIVVSLWR